MCSVEALSPIDVLHPNMMYCKYAYSYAAPFLSTSLDNARA